MPRTARNIAAHELIGLGVEVARCTDRKMEGMRGIVVDETKNTLVIESRGKEATVPKRACVFRFTLPEGKAEVDGRLIAVAPEDRTKKMMKHCG